NFLARLEIQTFKLFLVLCADFSCTLCLAAYLPAGCSEVSGHDIPSLPTSLLLVMLHIQVITLLRKERKAKAREAEAVRELYAAMQSLESPIDAPPADPDVWPAPPPKRTTTQSTRTKTVSTKNRNNEANESIVVKKPVRKSSSQNALSDRKPKQGAAAASTSTVSEPPDSAANPPEEKRQDEFVPKGYCP
ncbi:hypothetical protein NECAME_05401, partial [Necator americanus]